MKFREGVVVEATAFFDSIAFNDSGARSSRRTSQTVQKSTASNDAAKPPTL